MEHEPAKSDPKWPGKFADHRETAKKQKEKKRKNMPPSRKEIRDARKEVGGAIEISFVVKDSCWNSGVGEDIERDGEETENED